MAEVQVTFDRELLDRLLIFLGDADGDLVFLLPYFEADPGAGESIQDISSHGIHATNNNAYAFPPVIRGNVRSTRFDGTTDYDEIADNVLLTPIAAGIDVPFSVGCACKMDAASALEKTLICKWDDQTPNAEWRLYVDANEYPSIEVFDDSVANSEHGREDQTALVADTWYIIIATYDGRGADNPMAGFNIYRWDGATRNWDGAVDDADINGAGVYVDMEDTAQPVMIGAADTAGGPVAAEFWDGEIVLPWFTRRELSAAEALRVARQMVRLMEL